MKRIRWKRRSISIKLFKVMLLIERAEKENNTQKRRPIPINFMKQKEPNFLQSKFKSPSHKLRNQGCRQAGREVERQGCDGWMEGRKASQKQITEGWKMSEWEEATAKENQQPKEKRSIKSGRTILYRKHSSSLFSSSISLSYQ